MKLSTLGLCLGLTATTVAGPGMTQQSATSGRQAQPINAVNLNRWCGQPVHDIEGNIYRTVQIGRQCWMADNLRTVKYRNGESIQQIPRDRPPTNVEKRSGLYGIYDHKSYLKEDFGNLYTFATTQDPRGLCPAGWNVPSIEDWAKLFSTVARSNRNWRGYNAALPLMEANNRYWKRAFPSWNALAFNGRGGGQFGQRWNRQARRGEGPYRFHSLREIGYYWSSTGVDPRAGAGSNDVAWVVWLDHLTGLDELPLGKDLGLSIRCLKSELSPQLILR